MFQKNILRTALGVPKLPEKNKNETVSLLKDLKTFTTVTSELGKESKQLYEKLKQERDRENDKYKQDMQDKLDALKREKAALDLKCEQEVLNKKSGAFLSSSLGSTLDPTSFDHHSYVHPAARKKKPSKYAIMFTVKSSLLKK